ncbi:MAG: ribonuclease P protein component [Deltaproteobacteria bacterium]|nr:ribonuclease P protein component [Deltaproteobacteria bacterium]
MKRYSFPKRERLLNRKDFVNLNRLGKRYHTKHFLVIVKENETGINRLGVTVTKKIGNAVKRNRVKRLAREFFRLNRHHFSTGCDIVIIGKINSFLLNYTEIKEELGEIILNKGSVL